MDNLFFPVSNFTATYKRTKISATFVKQVVDSLLMFPKFVTMRYRQNEHRQLVISLNVTYKNGKKQNLEGAANVKLAEKIHSTMYNKADRISYWNPEQQEIYVASEGENMQLELLKKYLDSNMQCYIDKDWESPNGTIYRCVTFSHSCNMAVKFTLEATEEVNKLIYEACKSE